MKIKRTCSVFFIFLMFTFSGRAAAEETLTWKDCVLEAQKNHPDLVSSREKLSQSKASKNQTQSAFLPQVSSAAAAKRTKTPRSSSSSSTSEISDSYSYSVSGQQLLFDGFKTYDDVEAAAKTVEASQYSFEVTSSNVKLRLRTAFIDLLKADELLNITEDIAKRRKQSRELIQLRYNGGREHKGSLLTAEANLAQAEFEVGQAKRNRDLAERRLSKELGRTKLVPIKINADFNVSEKDPAKPDFESLSQTNPLLRELVVEKEAARWGVRSAVAAIFPQVYATTSAGRTASVWPPRGKEWSVGASFSMPLFEGGNLMAGIAKAAAAARQAEADERSGRDGVIFTLEDNWTQFQDALGQVDVKKKFLEAGQEREKIAEAQYSAGLVTFNDWIIIEDNLVTAEKSYLDAQTNALLAEANWVQARGDTLDGN